MEHYCIKTRKEARWYSDPECKKRDFLYEYQVTGKMPLFIQIIQGRVGKQFVVKHYCGKRLKNGKRRRPRILMTRVPDMSNIVASEGQQKCRNLFKEAVAFAKLVIADAELKDRWKQRYRISYGWVYYRAMKVYMLYLQRGTAIEEELLPEAMKKVKPATEHHEEPEQEDELPELPTTQQNEKLMELPLVIGRRELRLAG